MRLREGRGMGGQPFNFPLTCSWRWRVTACLDSWVEALDIFVSVEPVKVSRFQLCFNLDRKVKVTQLWPKSQSWKKFICRPLIPTVARSKLLNFDPKVKVTQLWLWPVKVGKSCEKKPFVVSIIVFFLFNVGFNTKHSYDSPPFLPSINQGAAPHLIPQPQLCADIWRRPYGRKYAYLGV